MARKSTSEKRRRRHTDSRMYARTRNLRKLNVVAFYILVVIASVGVISTSLPELRALQLAEEELTSVQQQEFAINALADKQLREYHALEQDPQFLEIYGRDRLDLYKEGERIFRFSRPD